VATRGSVKKTSSSSDVFTPKNGGAKRSKKSPIEKETTSSPLRAKEKLLQNKDYRQRRLEGLLVNSAGWCFWKVRKGLREFASGEVKPLELSKPTNHPEPEKNGVLRQAGEQGNKIGL